MKKTILISMLALVAAMPAMAQYNRQPYRRPVPPRSTYANYSRPSSGLDTYYGLRLGLSVSTVNSDDRYLDGGSAKSGLNLGVVAGFQVAPVTPLYLETGLLYTEKGGKGSYGGHSFTYNLNYLEVPLVMKYQYNLDRLTSVQPFAGVYAAAGVGGKMKDFQDRQAYSAFSDDGLQRFDAGLRLGCGIQFDHLYAELGCDIGLANASHDYFDTARTSSFFANVGINF